MKPDLREVAAAGLPAVVLGLAFGAAAAVLLGTLEPAERATLWALVEPRFALVVMLWFVFSLAGGIALHRAWQLFGAAPGRLAEQVQVLLQTGAQVELSAGGSAGSRALAAAVGALVQQRDALRADIDAKVREASREVDQERSRLAALMAELTQSVVVCNLDGRILLFNSRARMQFRTLVDSTGPAIGGAEAIGLGRSIYAVFDRQLVAHALESVQQRLQRGAAHPSAQFVTGTRGGQLLRVQLAPVRASSSETAPVRASSSETAPVRASSSETAPVRASSSESAPVRASSSETAPVRAPGDGADAPLNGFVLMLDNITRDFADESERDQLLHQLTETSRASIGNLRAAVELLDDPGLEPAMRERFHGVVRDEVTAMSERFSLLADRTVQQVKTRWPMEDMRGADLVAATLRRIEQQHGCRTAATEVDASLWLKVDSWSLMQALVHLAGRLVDEHAVKLVQLRLKPADGRAQLDLVWIGPGMSTETVMSWETDPIRSGADSSPLSVRDVIERHAGAFWFERERVRHESFFRMLLPLADSSAALDAATVLRSDSRPEYYDFDLFKASDQARELAERTLAELSYTVFDTETTGLEPSAGDRILQFGATRINAGKLRRHDCFDQLVDPQRSIPPAGIPIHGITPEMVAGQPVIASVLPAFHAFAADTVLVAHNAAFDMRFLQLLEAETGIAFKQPVLDTLLLSAVVHPQQESHRLEAIAERLGVQVLGRHTALGDAMVTAEVFLKLVPLLEAMGIRTLGQALEASQKTYFARVTY
jgi:DNA polymerase III subunit epsilon